MHILDCALLNAHVVVGGLTCMSAVGFCIVQAHRGSWTDAAASEEELRCALHYPIGSFGHLIGRHKNGKYLCRGCGKCIVKYL